MTWWMYFTFVVLMFVACAGARLGWERDHSVPLWLLCCAVAFLAGYGGGALARCVIVAWKVFWVDR